MKADLVTAFGDAIGADTRLTIEHAQAAVGAEIRIPTSEFRVGRNAHRLRAAER
jgi:hypothetical protein